MQPEKRTSQYMSFSVDGEHMTRLLRTLWVEGRIQPALNIIESCGCPEQFWIKLFTGKAKMVGNSGDDSLGIVDDDTEYHDSIKLSFDSLNDRMVKDFIKNSVLYANADARMKYWPLRMDVIGVAYKTGKRGEYKETHGTCFSRDKVSVERAGAALVELKPFFTYIYPLMGKSIYDIPWHKVEEQMEEFDLYHPNYLPVMSDIAKNGKKVPTVDLKDELTGRGVGKYSTPAGKISDVIKHQTQPSPQELESVKKEKLKPMGLDDPNVTNAWIDRNGNFYGDRRFSVMFTLVHIELADKMQDDGIIPKYADMPIWNNGKPEPCQYLEGTGWIKLSANQFLYYPKNYKLKVTQAQINTIKKYAKVRNLQGVHIGYFDKNVPVDELTIETFER